jgi:hypothetical protein
MRMRAELRPAGQAAFGLAQGSRSAESLDSISFELDGSVEIQKR